MAPTCGTCEKTLARPFVCLHCNFMGCWEQNHVTEHLTDEEHTFCECVPFLRCTVGRCSSSIALGVDAKSGAIFCVECDDMVYDVVLDAAHSAAVLEAEVKETRFSSASQSFSP